MPVTCKLFSFIGTLILFVSTSWIDATEDWESRCGVEVAAPSIYPGMKPLNWHTCPENQYIYGVNMVLDKKAFGSGVVGDIASDAGFHGVRFYCSSLDGTQNTTLVEGVDDDIRYRGAVFCDGFAIGLQIRNIKQFADSFDCASWLKLTNPIAALFSVIFPDDAMFVTAISLNCSDKALVAAGHGILSEFDQQGSQLTALQVCPDGAAVCGFRAVKTSLSKEYEIASIQFKCAILPNEGSDCKPQHNWTTIASCDDTIACSFSVTSQYTKKDNASTKQSSETKTYRELGLGLGASKEQFKAKFTAEYKKTKIEGSTFTEIMGSITTTEERIDIEITSCTGQVQQLILQCGSLIMKTKQYRCFVPNEPTE